MLQLVQKILPELDLKQTAELLLTAAVTPEDVLQLDPEVAEGILGGEAKLYQTAAEPSLPPDIHQVTKELQDAAVALQRRADKLAPNDEGYWRPPAIDMKWTKEVCLTNYISCLILIVRKKKN